jgi:hypothetical protein
MAYLLIMLLLTPGGGYLGMTTPGVGYVGKDKSVCERVGRVVPTNPDGSQEACFTPVKAITSAEFSSQQACEEAKKLIFKEIFDKYATDLDLLCIPKR